MKKFNTVRYGYLYIFGGSALISGVFLAVAYSTAALLYSRYTSDSTVYWVRILHWLMNHIGRTPLAVLLFIIVFTGIFLLRSQNISDDLKLLLRAAEELSTRGFCQELKVASGGELGQLAANLRRINRPAIAEPGDLADFEWAQPEEPPLENEVLMALIIRVRTLQRLLKEAAVEEQRAKGETWQLEAAQHEVTGMERFLESLMACS